MSFLNNNDLNIFKNVQHTPKTSIVNNLQKAEQTNITNQIKNTGQRVSQSFMDFWNKTTTAQKITFVVLTIILFIIIYQIYYHFIKQKYITDGLVFMTEIDQNKPWNSTKVWQYTDPDTNRNLRYIPGKLLRNPAGSESTFTVSFWIYIDGKRWGHRFNQWKHVFHRGTNPVSNEEPSAEDLGLNQNVLLSMLYYIQEKFMLYKIEKKFITKPSDRDIENISEDENLEKLSLWLRHNYNKWNYIFQRLEDKCVEDRQDNDDDNRDILLVTRDRVKEFGMWVKSYFNEWAATVFGDLSGEDLNHISIERIKIQTPGVWITPKLNQLVCVFSTSHGLERTSIYDVPMNEWVNYTLVIDRSNMSIYHNCKLVKTVNFLGNVTMLLSNMYVNYFDGFAGNMAYLQYYKRALSPKDICLIYENYKKGIDRYLDYLREKLMNPDQNNPPTSIPITPGKCKMNQ